MKISDVKIGTHYQAGKDEHYADVPRRCVAIEVGKARPHDSIRKVHVRWLNDDGTAVVIPERLGCGCATETVRNEGHRDECDEVGGVPPEGQWFSAADLQPYADWHEAWLPREAARQEDRRKARRLTAALDALGADAIKAREWRTRTRWDRKTREHTRTRVLVLEIPEADVEAIAEQLASQAELASGLDRATLKAIRAGAAEVTETRSS